MKKQLYNEKLRQLLDEHKLTQAELSRRTQVSHKHISNVCLGRRNLGEALFAKILLRGFGYSEKEARGIFLRAVESKYFGGVAAS